MTQELLFDKRGEIGWITFNRPQARNALTFAMYEGLAEICSRIGRTQEAKTLVITGAGDKAFAAGTDIAQFLDFKDGEDGIAYERKMDRILDAIERCAVPTIAAVAGFCTGGGIEANRLIVVVKKQLGALEIGQIVCAAGRVSEFTQGNQGMSRRPPVADAADGGKQRQGAELRR